MNPSPSGPFRLSLALLCAVLFCLLGARPAGPPAPAELVETYPDLGLWRSILPFGSEAGAHPKARAFEEIGELLHVVDEVRAALLREPETYQSLRQIRNDLLRLDVDRIFDENPHFFTNMAGDRELRIRGMWEGDKYDIALGEVPLLEGRKPQLGNVGAEIVFHRNPLFPDLIQASTHVEADLGTLQYRELIRSWEVFNLLFSIPAIDREHWLARIPLPAKGFGDKLDPKDLELAAQWNGSLPTLSKLFSEVFVLEDFVNPSREGTPGGPSQVRFALRLNRDALARLYPEDFANLRFFLDRVSFKTTLLLPQGTHLAHLSYQASEHRLVVDFLTQEGGFVVTDAAGFSTGEVLSPSQVKKLEYVAMTDVRVNVYGLSVFFEELPFECRYEAPDPWDANERLSRFSIQFRQPPKVRTQGAFLYVFPPWLIDILVPGTLEGIFNDAFNLMTGGNGGEGIVAHVDFIEGGGFHRIDADLSLELPYQLLGPVVRDIINREWTEPGTRPGERPQLLLADLRHAVREDFERMHRQEAGKP